MESINVLKGYGKVNSSNLETQTTSSPTHRKSFIVTFAISAVILLTLIISLIVAAAISDFDFGTESSAESIRSVCNVTRFPDSCFESISSVNPSVKADPEAIFKVSVEVSINEVKNVSSQFRSLSQNQNHEAAVDDCLRQLEDALSNLNDSLAIMGVGSGEKALTEGKMKDIQTWISAAMTYEQTCLDGLEEKGSTIPEGMKGQLEKCNEVLSNSLAIVAKMQTLVNEFHLKLH